MVIPPLISLFLVYITDTPTLGFEAFCGECFELSKYVHAYLDCKKIFKKILAFAVCLFVKRFSLTLEHAYFTLDH